MKRSTWIQRGVAFGSALLAIAALTRELRTPAGERAWRGRILGVPYDFRPPTPDRFRRALWRPDSRSLFTDTAFGVGWGVNLALLLRLLRYARNTIWSPY